jgi:hypothetical protein
MSDRTLNEKLALKILANEGIEAIWRLLLGRGGI